MQLIAQERKKKYKDLNSVLFVLFLLGSDEAGTSCIEWGDFPLDDWFVAVYVPDNDPL